MSAADDTTAAIAAVHALLERYQQAHRDQDWDAMRACHHDHYFRWAGAGSDDPLDWMPQMFYTRTEMAQWGELQIPENAVYANQQEFLKTQIRDGLALCVVRETGSWTANDGRVLGSWDGDINVWFVARIDGEWKISACFFRRVPH